MHPSIRLSKSEATITVGGDPLELEATTVPSNATVTYTSSDTDVATVDTDGVVTAVDDGVATITGKITYNGKDYTATCVVTVTT